MTEDLKTAQKWADAWDKAYTWRSEHFGKMPDEKQRKMMRARERSDKAFAREQSICSAIKKKGAVS